MHAFGSQASQARSRGVRTADIDHDVSLGEAARVGRHSTRPSVGARLGAREIRWVSGRGGGPFAGDLLDHVLQPLLVTRLRRRSRGLAPILRDARRVRESNLHEHGECLGQECEIPLHPSIRATVSVEASQNERGIPRAIEVLAEGGFDDGRFDHTAGRRMASKALREFRIDAWIDTGAGPASSASMGCPRV